MCKLYPCKCTIYHPIGCNSAIMLTATLLHMAAPTRAKKRLGSFLTGLRDGAGKTAAEAAEEIRASPATVSRYESGHVLPVWPTVRAFLDFYKASAQDRDEAARLWDDAKHEPPPVRLPAGTPKAFRRLVSAEREAETARTIGPYVVPGLLQTRNYALALFRAAHRFNDSATNADELVSARLARQRRLFGPNPPRFHLLLDEAVIRRRVGGIEVMREQLEHLLSVANQPHITLQVIPFEAGAYGTMSGSCMIITYPRPDEPPSVYLEYPAGGSWVDNEEDVRPFTGSFDDAIELALSPTDTVDLIRREIRALTER
jgi:transcriptional regulator with XRE-family HTH domain